MKQFLFEIIRQKWRLLSIILVLVLLNIALGTVISMQQIPHLADLHMTWNDLRRQLAGTGQVDAATLYHQNAADLETLKKRIPEKREFARVLSELYADATSSSVELGSVNYKVAQIKGEPLLAYELSLTVTGSYAAVKSYLADLEKKRELLVIDSVSFANSDPLVEHIAMDLHITVYLQGAI